MSDVFISYSHSTRATAQKVAEALGGLGYGVWLDDQLPAHRPYTEVIEERVRAAKAVVVIWSAEAAKSEWVRSEAGIARAAHTLVQLTVDKAPVPMPFEQIQCADLRDWTGDLSAPGWQKVVSSIADLVGAEERPLRSSLRPQPPKASPGESPPPLPGIPSIAILPFANLSNEPDQEYFTDGMVEEITTALSRVRSIFVIASSSSLSFKRTAADPRDAARTMGVRYVLEGSVRKAAERVRIAVRLIDATSGSQVWADRFERTLADVFALQDDVAISVAGVIEPTVERAEILRESRRPTANPGAYDFYLRACAIGGTRKPAEVAAALDLLDHAVALDPNYGAALATAANAHSLLAPRSSPENARRHSHEAVRLSEAALRCSSDDAQVLTTVALTIANVKNDLEAAIALVDRALALNPGASFSWYTSGLLRSVAGEADAAAEHLERSIRLDPLSNNRFDQLAWLGIARIEQQRYADAAKLLAESTQLEPGFPLSSHALAACYGHLGNTKRAREALDLFDAAIGAYGEATSAARTRLAERFRRPEHQRLFLEGLALAEAISGNAAAD